MPEDVADVGQRNADVLRRYSRTVGRSRVIRIRPGYAQPPTAATAPTSDKRRALRITQRCS